MIIFNNSLFSCNNYYDTYYIENSINIIFGTNLILFSLGLFLIIYYYSTCFRWEKSVWEKKFYFLFILLAGDGANIHINEFQLTNYFQIMFSIRSLLFIYL